MASPSPDTQAGRAVLAKDPASPGSLGIAISEAVEDAATRGDTKYALGSVLNHVLMHQTVIGLEAKRQFETGDWTAARLLARERIKMYDARVEEAVHPDVRGVADGVEDRVGSHDDGAPRVECCRRTAGLARVVSQIEKQYGKGAIMRLGLDHPLSEIDAIPTGALNLDAALGVRPRYRGYADALQELRAAGLA